MGGISEYGGRLASCSCLEVLSHGRSGGLWWPAHLLSLSGGSIMWAGRGLCWPAGLLCLSGGSITWAERAIIVAGWPLVIVWRFHYVGRGSITRAGWGITIAGLPLAIVWRFYYVGWAGDYGGWLPSCYCLEVLSRWLGRGLWWPARLLLLSVSFITLAGQEIVVAGLLFSVGSFTWAGHGIIMGG